LALRCPSRRFFLFGEGEHVVGRPTARTRLENALRKYRENESEIAKQARAWLYSYANGEIHGSVSKLRSQMHAWIELLDREEGKPTATVKVQADRQPGTVIIGSADSRDPRTLPVPDELPN
jgi:hypothetical protein